MPMTLRPLGLRLSTIALAWSALAAGAMAQTDSEAALYSKPHVFSMRVSDGNAGRVTARPRAADQKINAFDGGAYWVQPQAVVSGAQIADVALEKFDDGGGYVSPVIHVTLTDAGKQALAAFTGAHVGQSMVYVLDDQVIGAPVEVTSRVEDGSFLISKAGDVADMRYFTDQIRLAAGK